MGRPQPLRGAASAGELRAATGQKVADELPGELAPGGTGWVPARRPGNHVGGRPAAGAGGLPLPGAGCCSCMGCDRPAHGASATRRLARVHKLDRRRARSRGGAAQPAEVRPVPTHPVQPSPYTPSSRRFANPLALRIEDLDAYRGRRPRDARAEVDSLRVSAGTERIDHDLVWAAKRAALELLWRSRGSTRPLGMIPPSSTGWRDWATYCALAERHGGRCTRLAQALRDVSGVAVTAARRELAPRVAFHAWVQQRCGRAADRRARGGAQPPADPGA